MPESAWILFALGAMLAAVLARRFLLGRKDRRWWMHCEYWVYGQAENLPVQSALLRTTVQRNPFNKPGAPVITQREGLLFSDIRLHLALALRKRNPSAFRPDLAEGFAAPTPEALALLSECTSFCKVRFASERRLKHNGHLILLPHIAGALASLTKAVLVVDVVAGQIFTVEQFTEQLSRQPRPEGPGFHLRVSWEAGRAVTRGMRKVGLADWITEPQEADTEVLAQALLIKAAHHAFRTGDDSSPQEMAMHGAQFTITPTSKHHEGCRVIKIARKVGL
jgi:hypothetical protein